IERSPIRPHPFSIEMADKTPHRPSGRTRLRKWLRRARWVLLILFAAMLIGGVGGYLAPQERSFPSYQAMMKYRNGNSMPAPQFIGSDMSYVGDEAGSSYFLTGDFGLYLYTIPSGSWNYQPRFPYSMPKIRRVPIWQYSQTAL
ncbi:MAG: hypothetical protein JWO82_319, partial [Akkermansiaceae bacterium]|nr:hypothetical protein [Akkermansiaceae bacterium]